MCRLQMRRRESEGEGEGGGIRDVVVEVGGGGCVWEGGSGGEAVAWMRGGFSSSFLVIVVVGK